MRKTNPITYDAVLRDFMLRPIREKLPWANRVGFLDESGYILRPRPRFKKLYPEWVGFLYAHAPGVTYYDGRTYYAWILLPSSIVVMKPDHAVNEIQNALDQAIEGIQKGYTENPA